MSKVGGGAFSYVLGLIVFIGLTIVVMSLLLHTWIGWPA